MGYRVVQAYREHTGKSIVEATVVPAETLIRTSGFFD
ncbi:MAG: hypothetical protein AB8I80_07845 [Anaerolineae bacterium]